MPRVPRVTMKGSMRPLVISRPWIHPKTAPSTNASSMPSAITSTGEPTLGASLFISRIMQPAISAAIEPTDRSMPPLMMTKHMPTAMMPMKAVRVSTLSALSRVANSPLSIVPAMHRSTRPTIGPKPCRRPHRPAARSPIDCAAVSASSGGMGDQFLFAQVLVLHGGGEPAAAHHRGAVAQADQLHELRRDHDDGLARARQALHQEIDVALGADVDAARGFVQHDDPRMRLQHL